MRKRRREEDGGGGGGSCTVPSYVYTDWDYVRNVSKSNILIKDFVYYCIVQDSALYVL